jgi:hypothetical protein
MWELSNSTQPRKAYGLPRGNVIEPPTLPAALESPWEIIMEPLNLPPTPHIPPETGFGSPLGTNCKNKGTSQSRSKLGQHLEITEEK